MHCPLCATLDLLHEHLVGAGQGVWKAVFDPVADIQHAYTVTAELKSLHKIVLSNILFGDVWICSGQSNMKFPVERVFCICWLETVHSVCQCICM